LDSGRFQAQSQAQQDHLRSATPDAAISQDIWATKKKRNPDEHFRMQNDWFCKSKVELSKDMVADCDNFV
jgi:hypothetical protein